MAVWFTRTANKAFQRLGRDRRGHVMKRLELLDRGDRRNVKPLTGYDLERLRIGGLRVIFRRIGTDIEVIGIRSRGDAYKRM